MKGQWPIAVTLEAVAVRNGDMVSPIAVAARSGEIIRTRTDHPSTHEVGSDDTRSTIVLNNNTQDCGEMQSNSLDASRSQADVQRQHAQSDELTLEPRMVESIKPRRLLVLDEQAIDWFEQFNAGKVNKKMFLKTGEGGGSGYALFSREAKRKGSSHLKILRERCRERRKRYREERLPDTQAMSATLYKLCNGNA